MNENKLIEIRDLKKYYRLDKHTAVKAVDGVSFDIYKGEQIPADKKSIAYAIAYRDENKTLNEKDITKVHDKILKALEHKLGAVLR